MAFQGEQSERKLPTGIDEFDVCTLSDELNVAPQSNLTRTCWTSLFSNLDVPFAL